MASRRLDDLRKLSKQLPPASEFAIRNWIKSATEQLNLANAKAQLARTTTRTDSLAAEEAYTAFKKAAECDSILLTLSGYITDYSTL